MSLAELKRVFSTFEKQVNKQQHFEHTVALNLDLNKSYKSLSWACWRYVSALRPPISLDGRSETDYTGT